MSRGRFIVQGMPARMIAESLSENEEFLEDAGPLVSLSQSEFDSLLQGLVEFDGFVDEETLAGLVDGAVGTPEVARQLSSFLWGLNQFVRNSAEPFDEAVEIIGEVLKQGSEVLSVENRERLGERIKAVLIDSLGLRRFFKARQLRDSLGADFEDCQIVCDIRPVFNEERNKVEGALIVNVLRLEFTDSNGEPGNLEVYMSDKQIDLFMDKAKIAMEKIAVLREVLGNAGLDIPNT